MRQLSIALVLLALVSIGTFYLITQQLNLQRYQDPKAIVVPPRAHFLGLQSPKPGPSPFPFHAASSDKIRWAHIRAQVTNIRSAEHARSSVRWFPATNPVATPVQVTPMPAPTFAPYTMPPPVHLPPPAIPGYRPAVPQPDVTASPSARS